MHGGMRWRRPLPMTSDIRERVEKASERYRRMSWEAFDDGDRELATVYGLTADELMFAIGTAEEGEDDERDTSRGAGRGCGEAHGRGPRSDRPCNRDAPRGRSRLRRPPARGHHAGRRPRPPRGHHGGMGCWPARCAVSSRRMSRGTSSSLACGPPCATSAGRSTASPSASSRRRGRDDRP